jgi:hypothetical protein
MGIAIAGIWIGVGICSFNVDDGSLIFISFFAMIASGMVANYSNEKK